MNRCTVILFLLLWSFRSYTQSNLTRAEYFFDTDPGLGSALPIVGFTSSTTIDVTDLIDVSGLSIGLHTMGIRVMDDNLDWSMPEFVPVFVTPASASIVANVSAIEYFFDTDPGLGSALPIVGFTSSTTIDVTDLIDVSGLSIGMHTMGIRVMDDNLDWSLPEFVPVFVTPASASIVANVSAVEYFFDADPGLGLGTPITLTATQNFDISDMIPMAGLSIGLHTLNIRIRNEFNEWSIPEIIPVFVTQASALLVENIDAVEYFFDADPGIGLASPLTVTSTPILDIADLIPTAGLSSGIHLFNIRIRTTGGEWSLVESVPILVNQDNLITQLEYFIDTDPGIGGGTNIAITPPSDIIDQDIITSTGSLAVGNHTFNVRLGTADIWGQTESVGFNICTGALPNFTAPNTCLGDATNFTDTSTGVLAGDLYFWDFENDGTTDNTTSGNVSFTYSSPGTYVAELQIDQSGCEGYKFGIVEIVDAPTSAAGPDQVICEGDPVILSGAIGGSATTSLWTTSGDGTFTDDTNPATLYTPGIGDVTSGSVVLTFTASEPLSICNDVSTSMTVSINGVIIAETQSLDVSIAQPVNIDVLSSVTASTGDILTTTITQQPTKGTAAIQPNSTIDYIAFENNVGLDTIAFEVCNQCGNCDNGLVIINILNEPPTITVPSISTSSGTIVTIDLLGQLFDLNGNIDLSSLTIISSPQSGAVATIDASSRLVVDYTSIMFSGTDQLTIQICDFLGVCTNAVIFIEVLDQPSTSPQVTIYNAVSPNGDGKHDYLELENILNYPSNRLIIYDRWGNKVFEVSGYNNSTILFNGMGNTNGAEELPAGTYYYLLELGEGTRLEGFFLLKT
ncbi:MAG: gliding motility-associated C-terminal domain-containing protein [Bacteroidota bacterium]